MSEVLTSGRVAPGDRLPQLTVDVTARLIVMGASASRDWQPQHHDHEWAVRQAGTRDIFVNTPTQAGWIERFLTDWTGPRGRLGRMELRMRRSLCPGDVARFGGTVRSVTCDELGCWWVEVGVEVTVDAEPVTVCTARVAVPNDAEDNPWSRTGESWRP